MFAVGPGHCLDDDATGFAVDAAHAVEEKDQVPPDTPDRNELELPIREVVVAGGLAGDSQNRSLGSRSGADSDLQAGDDLESSGRVDSTKPGKR